jgi:tetratricopeptide (TPR) repeat protein
MNLQALFDQAVDAHQGGRLDEAEQLYRQLLAAEPGNPQLLHPLGVLRAQQGHVDEALTLLHGLVAQRPTNAALLKDCAVVLAGAGRNEDALAMFDQALALKPDDLELLQLRIDVLLRLKRHVDALVACDQALGPNPATATLLHQRGLALAGLGRHADAQTCFAHVLELKPDSDAALYERGAALAAQHRIADWFAAFHGFAHHRDKASAFSSAAGNTSAHRARHDAEQSGWLRMQGIQPGARLRIEGGERLAGPAINPANAKDAAQQWRKNRPQVVVVDDLLTDEALAALRRFCLGSNVWRTGYESGYLGAFPETGFSAPLLAQIAEEFQTVFPEICGGLVLKYAWAFKYDSAMQEGVHIHADDAAVNVNFWITPDDANLDPQTGGLLVWDVPAPQGSDYGKFSIEQAAVRDFLANNQAKSITVPYRANRAAIFDSELFHKTDSIRFKDGYENRRINVTMLYGERGAGKLG